MNQNNTFLFPLVFWLTAASLILPLAKLAPGRKKSELTAKSPLIKEITVYARVLILRNDTATNTNTSDPKTSTE